jgi:pilus assembly protein CpaF
MFDQRPAMNKQSGNSKETAAAAPRVETVDGSKANLYLIRDKVQQMLLQDLDGPAKLGNTPEIQKLIEKHFRKVLTEEKIRYSKDAREEVLEWVLADILSYGPLDSLLGDQSITEVMVNGPKNVYIERAGKVEETDVTFEDEEHLMRIIDKIVSPIGRRVDESSPMVDARLPSGYRVNATIPPLSMDGPLLTIRKFASNPLTAQDLMNNGTLDERLITFLKASIEAKVNLIISGGTGSGKTTLLNVLSDFIPSDERIITIEDTVELQLKQKHVLRLEKRPPNVEGRGEITIRQLVINALRMRPDRIIVGEVRGGEALDMLQAMNTGHDGSITTAHSNNPRDTLRRIETMVLMAGMDLPLRAIREQVASSIEMVVHTDRLRDGSRKVVKVSEVQGLEGETIVMQDLFVFHQEGIKDGVVEGELRPTGLPPRFATKFIENSIELPEDIFNTKRVAKRSK